MAVRANFVSRYRQAIQALLKDIAVLRELRREWDAENYSGTLVAGDFSGANADLTVANLTSAVTSAQAVDDLCSANGNAHFTNLYKMNT